MTLDGLLARINVGRGEAARWFSSCTLVQNTLYVADMDDWNTITRCYQGRLWNVLPALAITFRPKVDEKPKPRVPSYIKKSKVKDYIEHHDLYGRK